MVKKYHVNLKTGRTGECKADTRPCPVKGQHFSTEAEAHEYKDEIMELMHDPFTSTSKPKNLDNNVVTKPFDLMLSKDTWRVIHALQDAGLEPLVVGGSVRDQLMGYDSKDIDMEIYGAESYNQISKAVKKLGRADLTGKEFGVVKLTMEDDDFDLSLPRTESKTGAGHRGFAIEVDPKLSKTAATARRDFTINALMWNPTTGQIEDYHGGLEDLKNKTLRATSEAFAEDPLRVLRGAQFAARFGFSMDKNTIEASKKLLPEYDNLSSDRIYVEMKKMYTKGIKKSQGLQTLVDTGWLAKVYGDKFAANPKKIKELGEVLDSISAKETNATKEFSYLSSVAYTLHHAGRKDSSPVGNYIASNSDYKKASKIAHFVESSGENKQSNSEIKAFARSLQDEGGMTINDFALLRSYAGHDENKLVSRAKKLNVADRIEQDDFDIAAIAKERGIRGPAIRDLLNLLRKEQYSKSD